MFLEISESSPENTFAKVCSCSFIKKEILAQSFSSGFCEISMNAFFTEHLQATASEIP